MRASIALVVIEMPKIVSVRDVRASAAQFLVNASSRNHIITHHEHDFCTACKHDRKGLSQSTFASKLSCALDTNLRKFQKALEVGRECLFSMFSIMEYLLIHERTRNFCVASHVHASSHSSFA